MHKRHNSVFFCFFGAISLSLVIVFTDIFILFTPKTGGGGGEGETSNFSSKDISIISFIKRDSNSIDKYVLSERTL